MIRFFIVFLFFVLSSLSFANTTFYYYEKNGGGFCSTSASGICAALTNLPGASCSLSGTTVVATWTTIHSQGTPNQYSVTSTGNAGIQRSIVCPVGYKMQLSGCTATCVKENKCESKLGQKEQRVAQCGMLTGGNCTSKPTPDAGDTFTKTCDTYKFDWLPLSGKYNLGGCEATVTKQVPLVKNNGNLEPNDVYDGSSNNIPLNCEIELTYNGQEFTDSPTSAPPSAPKSSTTGGSATKPTTDGSSGQPTDTTGGLKPSSNGTSDGVGTDTGGGNTGGGDTGGGDNSTCDPTKSICEGSGDGSAQTGDITRPAKIENTVTKSWWTSNYKDGMTGVWNKHKDNFQSTPFVQQLNEMKKGAPNSGTCPAFDFQFLQYHGILQPPCLIWPALKAFFLFMTLMLCRRIIFGG